MEGEKESYKEVVAWVKEHLVLPEFVPDKHWREEHDEVRVNDIHAVKDAGQRLHLLTGSDTRRAQTRRVGDDHTGCAANRGCLLDSQK